MKKLKINICNKRCWDITELIYKLLSDEYDLEISDTPDIVFGSVRFNNEFKNYPNAIKIQFIGESEEPYFHWNIDYSISMSKNTYNGRNLYCPLFVLDDLVKRENYNSINKIDKTKLICACFRNKNSFRNDEFNTLSKHIDIENLGGKIGKTISDKLNSISKYKFNFCFENKKKPGYCTEKIYDAYMAGCIPVYNGDPLITEIFNPKSFINCEGKSIEQIVNEINNVSNDETLYKEMISQPMFNNQNYILDKLSEVKRFLINIIENKIQ